MNTHDPALHCLKPSQQGFALLEALIAILIFSFGVLAVVGLQAVMTKATGTAKFRGDAAYLANNLMGRMWADIPNLAKYDTDSASAYAPRTTWNNLVTAELPSSSTVIDVTSLSSGGTEVTITISWQPAGEQSHRYSTTTLITN